MGLQAAIEGARYLSQQITWTLANGTTLDLTGATITATLQDKDETVTAATGTMIPDADQVANKGVFLWTYSAADVAAPGHYLVRFTATISGLGAKTFISDWFVEEDQPVAYNHLVAIRRLLEQKISPVNNVPDYFQYLQATYDAIEDFSNRAGLRKSATIAVISGTPSYSLPADFLKLIRLEEIGAADGLGYDTAGRLVPLGRDYREEYTIANGTITFVPTPSYSSTRRLWYKAAFVRDANDVYQDLTHDDIRILTIKSRFLLVELQANEAAAGGFRYRDGDVEVDKKGLQSSYKERLKSIRDEYEQALLSRMGTIGMRTDYWDVATYADAI